MVLLDYLVLVGYFALMSGIGVWAMSRIKVQEDYLLGGRGFGKLLQTFAAFGAGTGSGDPVNTARTVFTGGASGMWSVMYWLFVTPFYWITAVWYRRMRHLTLGDWFVERYESKRLGAAYAVFGVIFYMVYGSMLFSAIGKVAAPLVGIDYITLGGEQIGLEYVLVPIIGLVVLFYGIAGGLHAAYWTDLVQGLCIILLSVLLLPYGLSALVEKFGDPATQGLGAGFGILHAQLPANRFDLLGGEGADFTLSFLIGVVILNLVGIVIQPHFIATGGGSAKTENDARVGLVVGNFLKRLCTVGWLLTALIALALYADDAVLNGDPDKVWGVTSHRLLGPGLTGLMLACLLAALMSSIDAYMVVGSGLIVRNIYAPFIDPNAGEREYVRLARATGAIIVGGAVLFSLSMMNVFQQLQLSWVVPVLFAAPFWAGMYWRGATTAAAWTTALFGLVVFFILPQCVENFSVYTLVGIDVKEFSSSVQGAMQLAPKIVLPFIVMIGTSLVTPRNSKESLDRYYAKMKTPVLPDPEEDRRRLEQSFADPSKLDHKKLWPGSSLEFDKPTVVDAVGFVGSVAACFAIVGLAYWVVGLGG